MAKKETSIATSNEEVNAMTANPMAMLINALGVTVQDFKNTQALANSAVDRSAIQVSRVQICQSNTPEVMDGMVKIGQLMDSITKEPFTKEIKAPWLLARGAEKIIECCLFLPVFNLATEYVKWPTKEERDAGETNPHWKSLNLQDPRVQEGLWKPEGKWSGEGMCPVTKSLNVIGMMVNPEKMTYSSNPVILSFSRTSGKAGKGFITACMSHSSSNLPNFWGRAYWLYTETAVSKKDAKKKYKVLQYARGPSIVEMSNAVPEKFQEMAIQAYDLQNRFTDLKTGIQTQEMFLNIAEIQSDSEVPDSTSDDILEGSIGSDEVVF